MKKINKVFKIGISEKNSDKINETNEIEVLSGKGIIGLPELISNATPIEINIIPSVVIIDGTPIQAAINPLMNPHNKPLLKPQIIANITGKSNATIINPDTHPARVATIATEISIPPPNITIVTPRDNISKNEISLETLYIFADDQKTGLINPVIIIINNNGTNTPSSLVFIR